MQKTTLKHYYLPIGLIILMSIFLPIIHTSDFRYTFIIPKFALYDIGCSIITLYYFYYTKKFKLSLLPTLTLLVLLFMIISIIQASNIIYSIELIFRFFNFFIFISLLYNLLTKEFITLKHIGNLLLFSTLIFIMYYFYGTYIETTFTTPTSFSPIGHVNYTTHVLNIWIPLLFLNFYIQKNVFFKYSSIFIMIILINIVILTGSRGSILGLILSELFIVVLLFIKYKKIKLYPIITLLLLSSFFINKYYSPSSVQRISNKINIMENTLQDNKTAKSTPQERKFTNTDFNKLTANRFNVYNNTIAMIIDNPWGVGAGNYEYIHPKYAKLGTPFKTPYITETKVWTNPHNIILKFTSELNWLGGLIFIFLIILISKMVLTIILNGKKIDYMISIGFGATMFHSMFSAVFLTPAQLFFTTFLFTLIIYRYYSIKEYKTLFSLNKVYSKSFLLFIPLFFILFYSSKYYNQQFTAQRNFSFLEKALFLNPYNDQAIIKRAQFAAYANKDYSLAIYYLDKYLKLYPYNINGHIKKANFEYKIKRYHNALKTVNSLLSFDNKNKKMLNLKKEIMKKLKK